MCDKTVASYLIAITFASDWFVTSKIIENLDKHAFSNDDIIFCGIHSDRLTRLIL